MKTILIADDDAGFRGQLGAILERAGYGVLEAETGDEALGILDRRHETIDLVIVDLVLPETDGFQVIGAVTRRTTLMKVIATTGLLRQRFLEVCKYMGAHAVLRKPQSGEPFPEREWLETIATVLGAESDLGRTGAGG